MKKFLFVLECALWAAVGGMLAYSGVPITTWQGGVVWALLLAISFVHAHHAVCAYREGQIDGAATAVVVLHREGWRKQ